MHGDCRSSRCRGKYRTYTAYDAYIAVRIERGKLSSVGSNGKDLQSILLLISAITGESMMPSLLSRPSLRDSLTAQVAI